MERRACLLPDGRRIQSGTELVGLRRAGRVGPGQERADGPAPAVERSDRVEEARDPDRSDAIEPRARAVDEAVERLAQDVEQLLELDRHAAPAVDRRRVADLDE